MPRYTLGPVCVDDVTPDDILAFIAQRISSRIPAQIITLNALMFNAVRADQSLVQSINNAALVIPDSAGVIWAVKHVTGQRLARITGIDSIYAIARQAAHKGWRLYLLGAKQGIAAQSAARLQTLFPGLIIAGTHHGYFNDTAEIVSCITETKPDILLAGLAMPYQELWLAQNLATMNIPIVMGVGGSFDVISGNLRRAPAWMQRMGLEWLFRLIMQPWRISRMKDLPLFVMHILFLKRNNPL